MKTLLGLFIGIAVVFCQLSFADLELKRRFDFDSKLIRLGAGGTGWVLGFTYDNYIPNLPISYGIAGYFGSPTGENVQGDNLAVIGVPVTVDGHLSERLIYSLGGMPGYAQGNLSGGTRMTGVILEQSISVGFVLGGGWRVALQPGYLYCFNDSNFSGFTYGIRIERKTLQTIRGRDD